MRLIEFFEATRLDELVNPDNPKFRKWFRNSKVTDITGKRPQMVFHGTKSPHEFIELQPGTHFGTPGQAEEFAAMSGGDRPRTGPGRIFPVYLRIENPIEMWDSQASHGDDPDAYLRDLITHAESVDDRNLVDRLKLWANAINWDNIPDEKKPVRLIAFLKKLGYDGIVYSNRQEDKGYRSWIPFNKSQIKYVYAESITEAVVYHGSPHKFDRFDVSFMGSGEGNQTYGWGIYFAEHPEVAQSYQQMGDRWAEWRGQKILYPWHRNSDDMPSEISIAGTALAQANGDPEEARHIMAKYMYSDYRQMPKLFGRVFKNLPELAKQIEVKSTQNFYTVEIPDQVIARMLLWDYTLDHQPPNVQKVIRTAIQEFGIQHKEGVTDGWAYYDRIGQALSNNPSEQHKAASEYLNQRGVPGQRYLDQESRSQGEGTHNIVLFDPRHAKILDRRTPVGETLTEGASPILYHFTHTGNLGKILADNEFSLATSLGTGAESPHDVKGSPYYLSTTRSKTGAYHQSPGNYSAMLVLDGQALAQNYKVKPVDYWGQGFGQSEDEDRVYSREQTIPNASKYIKEIHILTEMKDFPGFSGDQTRRGLRKALIDGKKLGIPLYLYRDRKAWLVQDKRKALPISQALDKPQEPEKRWPSMKKTNWFKPWLELYYQNTAEKLSQDATRLLKNLRYDDYNGQVTRRLLNDVHNDKRSPNVAALVKVMKKHRLRTVPDYTALLKKKWGISESVQEEPPRFIDMGAGEERDYEIRKFIQALIAQSQSDRGLWLPAAEFYELDMQEKTRAALKMINAHKDEARPVGSKWAAEFLRKVFMT